MADIEEIKKTNSMDRSEFKVGEVFQCGLIKVKVVESTLSGCCDGCLFHFNCIRTTTRDIAGPCSRTEREDRTDVIFVKMEE